MEQSSEPCKQCTICGEFLPLERFHVARLGKFGRAARCKGCVKQLSATYYLENSDRINERNKSWKAANREKANAAKRRRRKRDVEKARAERRRSYLRNKEAENARARAYHAANAERRRAQLKEWKLANPEKAAELAARHLARRRAKTTRVEPVDLRALWDGFCGICGDALDEGVSYPDPMSKSLDHIIPLAKGGTHTRDNLQWSHLTCNMRKSAKMPEAS